MSERELEIHRVLTAEDPELAGLFVFLLRAVMEVERPGGVHMLGHAGRELSLGVLRYLANDGRPLTDEEQSTISKDERHRGQIARALRLQPNHPSVTGWLKAHTELTSFAHYNKGYSAKPSSREGALAAANALVSLLWSRTGPFFGAKADIERLLSVETPTFKDIDELRAALTRPAVRWDFFKRLESPGWVAPLLEGGFFKDPPDILPPDKDGRRRWEGWAEGEYLRRMAVAAPNEVRDAIATIPLTLRNPYVWDTAAEAAKVMPPEIAVTLVPNFREAVKNSLPGFIQETCCEVAIRLAEGGKTESFLLARDALRVVEGRRSAEGIMDGTDRKDAALFGLEEYEAQRLIPQLATSLEAIDSERALTFLMHRLSEALVIEEEAQSEPSSWDRSASWCSDLSRVEGHHGFKEPLVVAIAQIAAHEARKGELKANAVLKRLAEQPWKVCRRMRLYVLALAGEIALEALNVEIANTGLIIAEHPGTEYLLLLTNQFDRSSREARNTFASFVESGAHSNSELRELLTDGEDVPTDEDIRKFRVRWQRKRLRRFGENIPSELKQLADRLDADDSVPKPVGAELELEDRGHTGVTSWSADSYSPLSPDSLGQLAASVLIRYVQEFKPTREAFDSPTPAGLATAIASRVRADPGFGIEFARLLQIDGIDPTYCRGTLQGFVGAAEESRHVAWSEVLSFVAWVAMQLNGTKAARIADHDYGDKDWRWAQREAAKLVGLVASKNLAVATDAETLWSAAEALLSSDATWRDRQADLRTVDAALSASLNSTAGESSEALVQVALWNHRVAKASSDAEHPAANVVSFPVERFRRGIGSVLARDGSSAAAARVQLGAYLPYLLLLDHDWVLTHATALFEGGFLPPLPNFVWIGYITRANLFNDVFNDLKDWYVAAAEALPPTPLDDATFFDEQKDGTWSTTRHLASHCMIADLRGLVAPLDPDRLLPLVFQGATIADRSHAYWEVYRGWDTSGTRMPDNMVDRLLAFWAWRLNVLDHRGPKEMEAEAGALGWFALMKTLPNQRVLELFSRTSERSGGAFPMDHSLWSRMTAFANIDLSATLVIVSTMIQTELNAPYPHFNIADIGPVLTQAMQSDSAADRQKAKDLMNLLGDNGFTEFGTLR